jgi:hypothetical protein
VQNTGKRLRQSQPGGRRTVEAEEIRHMQVTERGEATIGEETYLSFATQMGSSCAALIALTAAVVEVSGNQVPAGEPTRAVSARNDFGDKLVSERRRISDFPATLELRYVRATDPTIEIAHANPVPRQVRQDDLAQLERVRATE